MAPSAAGLAGPAGVAAFPSLALGGATPRLLPFVPGTLLTPAQVQATAQAVLQEHQHLAIAQQLQKAQEQLQHAQQLHQQAPHGSQTQHAQQLQQAQAQLQHAQQLFQAQVQMQLQQRILAATQVRVGGSVGYRNAGTCDGGGGHGGRGLLRGAGGRDPAAARPAAARRVGPVL